MFFAAVNTSVVGGGERKKEKRLCKADEDSQLINTGGSMNKKLVYEALFSCEVSCTKCSARLSSGAQF